MTDSMKNSVCSYFCLTHIFPGDIEVWQVVDLKAGRRRIALKTQLGIVSVSRGLSTQGHTSSSFRDQSHLRITKFTGSNLL